jgi:hypothetical protein
MLPNQNMPMPPPPTGGAAVPGAPAPNTPPQMAPTEAKAVITSQLRQAYSELKALAASAGIEWREVEAAGVAPAGAGPLRGPPPLGG